MKKMILATAIASVSVLSAMSVYAEDAVPDNSFAYTALVTSDYRYRGISQTRLKSGVQVGADYTHNPTGFYAGAWAYTIQWIEDLGGSGNIEVDFYGGNRGNISEDLTYDIGVIAYIYQGNDLPISADTTELYAQLGYGPAYIKYSSATTDLFGVADTKNSGYLDVGANIEIGESLILNLHAGHQEVNSASGLSYDDWKIGVTKDFGFATVALAAIGTNADEPLYTVKDKYLGKNAAVLTVSKTF